MHSWSGEEPGGLGHISANQLTREMAETGTGGLNEICFYSLMLRLDDKSIG